MELVDCFSVCNDKSCRSLNYSIKKPFFSFSCYDSVFAYPLIVLFTISQHSESQFLKLQGNFFAMASNNQICLFECTPVSLVEMPSLFYKLLHRVGKI